MGAGHPCGSRRGLALSVAVCPGIDSACLGGWRPLRAGCCARGLGDRDYPKAGTQFDVHKPTTAIVENGPYRFTRNPIYLGMFLSQAGIAIGFDDLWVLATLVPFYFVIRHGVVAREEAYLERKFGAVYLGYKSRVRRWL